MALVVEIDEKELCRVCGCTDEDCYCCYEHSGNVCYWTEPDLCSTCAEGPPCPGERDEYPDQPPCYSLDVDGEPVLVRASADPATVQAITELVRQLRSVRT